MEEENSIKKNPEVELKEYKIISQYMENIYEGEKYKEIDLPTPESLEKICSQKIVKDNLEFDIKKYKSFIEIKQDENEEKEEKSIINLDKVESIKNGDLIPYILIFLGGLNSNTDIYNYFDDTVKLVNDEYLVDNSPNYMDYINSIIVYLKRNEKISVPFSQISLLFKILEELGLKFYQGEKNVFYKGIKDAFFSTEKNKILVIITPSNNFWVKSEKTTINDQNYDIKLNNYSKIFYNKKFISRFLKNITKHPRCTFGLLSSMSYKNLKNCWEGLQRMFNTDCPKDILFFDQKDHDEIRDPKEKKPKYFRNINKIKEHLKNEREKNKTKEESENTFNFDERNILILESEFDKKVENTEYNSIDVNLFDEKYLEMTNNEKKTFDLEGKKVINYVYKLLENCTDDIRVYINRNKLTDEYSTDLVYDDDKEEDEK